MQENSGVIVQPMFSDTDSVAANLSITDGVATATTNVTTLRKCDISITKINMVR